MSTLETCVIVPTYNEADNIEALLSQLLDLPVSLGVIVVDDNSPDGTGRLADSWVARHPDRVRVIHRAGKLGLGTAYLAGFRLAIEELDARNIMTMDADFSHNPRYIPAMIALSAEKHVVIGSRYVKGGGQRYCTWKRVMLSRGGNFVARLLLGLKARDATAGFRLYRREVLTSIPLERIFSSGYSFLVEMLFLCQRAGWQIGEVPIIFEDRRLGTTKISRNEVLKAQYTLLRLFYRRLRRRTPQKPSIEAIQPMISYPCNLCGADDWRVRFPSTLPQDGAGLDVDAFRCTSPGYGEHAQIVTCNRCGHVYANPRWSPAELNAAYAAVEDNMYVRERDGRMITFARHLRHLERHIGAGRGRDLLDVGAYIGVFVEVARDAGWQAVGVEPSTWAAAEARRLGLDVYTGTQEAPELAGRRFDVVTMWDVIEHVDDPRGELVQAFELLRPGGVLAVHTMDIDSLTARLLGRRWPWLMAMHVHYFSRRTLLQMLEAVGYQVLWSGVQGRYLRLGYVANRVAAWSPWLGRLVEPAVRGLRLTATPIPINFGDLFTVYARRPDD